MGISVEEVEKMAKLARIELSADEKEKYCHQLAEILDYMKKLNEVDTEGVQPTYHIHDTNNVFRVDRVKSWINQKKVLNHAPKKHAGYFSVPKVISKD